jgi:hypothetical protein
MGERPPSPSRKHEIYELPVTKFKGPFICREQDLPLAPAPPLYRTTFIGDLRLDGAQRKGATRQEHLYHMVSGYSLVPNDL